MPVMSVKIVRTFDRSSWHIDWLRPQSCSIECYKSHQANHIDEPCLAVGQSVPYGLPPRPPPGVASTHASNYRLNGSRPSVEIYSPSSPESFTCLQTLYTRYPPLRDQLKEIYEATTEPLDDQPNDLVFGIERSDRGRGRGRKSGPGRCGRTAATWSRHKGIKSGIHRLRMLRHLNGEDGDGLREFCKLVTGPVEAKKLTFTVPEVGQ